MAKRIAKDGGLSNRAMLVSVKISQWAGRKTDVMATEKVRTTFNTGAKAGNYSKRLLPGSSELQEISALSGTIRKYFHSQTLPWMTDGSRIISSANFLPFVSEMKKLQQEFDSAVTGFLAAYPKLKKDAEISLGSLYNPEEYPENIKERFGIEIIYSPMPESRDFRTEISETEKKRFESKMREVEQVAMKECWNRLYEVVSTASEKLKSPDAVFRDSLIENIKEMVDLLPRLNISNDKNLEKMRKEIESKVSGIDLKEVRKDADKRKEASDSLKKIEDRMGAFMGAKK